MMSQLKIFSQTTGNVLPIILVIVFLQSGIPGVFAANPFGADATTKKAPTGRVSLAAMTPPNVVSPKPLTILELKKNQDMLQQDLRNDSKLADQAFTRFAQVPWKDPLQKARAYLDYVKKVRQLDQQHQILTKTMIALEALMAPTALSPAATFEAIERKLGSERCDIRLLNENNVAWYGRWWVLSQARESIDIQYFYFQRDPMALSIFGLLLKKAREGVKIDLMMDARGDSRSTNSFFKKEMGGVLSALRVYPNVIIKLYNPPAQSILGVPGSIRSAISSNHDKIICVDNRLVILGGRNLAEYYFADLKSDPTAFRDTDILMSGREVAEKVKAAFHDEFDLASNQLFTEEKTSPKPEGALLDASYEAMSRHIFSRSEFPPATTFPKETYAPFLEKEKQLLRHRHIKGIGLTDIWEQSHQLPVTVLDKQSFLGYKDEITDAFVRYIDGAKKEIILQTPMVVMTERAEKALKRAATRGVKIFLHTNSPTSTDANLTVPMFYGDWKRLLKEIPTLRIWAFAKRKLHAKIFVFDGEVTIVGSYNLDYVSEQINSEITVAVNGAEFADEVRAVIQSDIKNSDEYRISIDDKGKATSIFGPDKQVNGWFKVKMEVMGRLRFLRPFI